MVRLVKSKLLAVVFRSRNALLLNFSSSSGEILLVFNPLELSQPRLELNNPGKF
jgi:hypothetical protein